MADPVTMAIGLAMAGTATKAIGSAAGANADAQASDERARVAGIQADQTTASSMFSLRRSIGNIKAVLAGSNVSVNSPTSQALMDAENDNSMANLNKRVSGIKLQQQQDEIDASTYRSKSAMALFGGALGMASDYANNAR